MRVYMNNHQAPHFDTFLHVFGHLGGHLKLKVLFARLCSVPCRSTCTSSSWGTAQVLFCVAWFYWFAREVWAFMEEWKCTAGKGAECGTIIVLSQLLYFHNRWRPKSKFRLIAQLYSKEDSFLTNLCIKRFRSDAVKMLHAAFVETCEENLSLLLLYLTSQQNKWNTQSQIHEWLCFAILTLEITSFSAL